MIVVRELSERVPLSFEVDNLKATFHKLVKLVVTQDLVLRDRAIYDVVDGSTGEVKNAV